MKAQACSNCGSSELYQSTPVSAGAGYGPNFLPGLGGWFRAAHFYVVVCRQCGLAMFFAADEALEKLPEAAEWGRLT